jgi:hypothetical protein
MSALRTPVELVDLAAEIYKVCSLPACAVFGIGDTRIQPVLYMVATLDDLIKQWDLTTSFFTLL